MKKILMMLCAGFALGCHGQVPPSTVTVALTWTAPTAGNGWAGCTTTAPCVYALSRAAVTGTSCPATTGTSYMLIGTSATNMLTYTDATVAPGTSYCWIVQTQQGTLTSQPSSPSNSGVPLLITPLPTAPGMPTASQATGTMAKVGGQSMPAPTLNAQPTPSGEMVIYARLSR